MTLKEIASINGKPGLYHIFKPSRTGVIVESLDGKKKKSVVHANKQISVLREISIFVNTAEDSIPLADVLLAIHEKYGSDVDVDVKDATELMAFMNDVCPTFDKQRVYPSDIKKLVSWYKILLEHAPSVFEEEKKAQEESEVEDKEEKK